MKKYALISTGIMLSGCLFVAPVAGLSAGAERLYGLTFSSSSLDIRVKSFGCTKADDFVVDVNSQNELTVIRKKTDRCRAMPRVITIQLPLPKAIEGDVYIKNSFAYP